MKYILILSTLLIGQNLLAGEVLMQSCGRFDDNKACHATSGTIAAGGAAVAIGNGINAARSYSEADLTEVNNTRVQMDDPNSHTILRVGEENRLLKPVNEGAKVTVSYYLTAEENKDRHVSNAHSSIDRIERNIDDHYDEARMWDTKTQSVYRTVYDTHTDADGKKTRTSRQVYVGEEPYPGRERHAAEHRRKARQLKRKDLPKAKKHLKKVIATDPSELPRLKQNKTMIAGYRASNVQQFIGKQRLKNRVVFGFKRVTADGMKEAKSWRVKGRWGVVGAIAATAVTATELATGGLGSRAHDAGKAGLEIATETLDDLDFESDSSDQ